MKIIFLANGVGPRVKSPEIELAEEFARQDHDVILGLTNWDSYLKELKKDPQPLQLGQITEDDTQFLLSNNLSSAQDVDVIYATSGGLSYLARKLAIHLKTVYGCHLEWIPPFRTGLMPSREWGEVEPTEATKKEWINYYHSIVTELSMAPFVTTCQTTLIPLLLKFLGMVEVSRFEVLYRRNHVDPKPLKSLLEKLENEDYRIQEDYSVITVSRLVPSKKIHYLMESVALLKKLGREIPTIKIIGNGPAKEFLQSYAKKLDIPVKFYGVFSGERKYRLILESEMMWAAWSNCLAEGLLAKKPCICYLSPALAETFGHTVNWVEWDNLQATATEILFLHNNPEKRLAIGKRGYEAIKYRKCNLWLLEDAANEFSENLEKWLA